AEGHELRAAASDIAARRDVSDWSRVAPEPRRPEPRRQVTRPEPTEAAHTYGRPGRADEPATEWPAPQRQSESARPGGAPVDRQERRDEIPAADGVVDTAGPTATPGGHGDWPEVGATGPAD